MTPSELKAARHTLGLTANQLGALIGVKQRMIFAMESGDKNIQKPQAGYVNAMLSGYRPPDWPE